MKKLKRITALLYCGLLIISAVLPLSNAAEAAPPSGTVVVGRWTLAYSRTLYAGVIRYWNDGKPREHVQNRAYGDNYASADDYYLDNSKEEDVYIHANTKVSWQDPPSTIEVYCTDGVQNMTRKEAFSKESAGEIKTTCSAVTIPYQFAKQPKRVRKDWYFYGDGLIYADSCLIDPDEELNTDWEFGAFDADDIFYLNFILRNGSERGYHDNEIKTFTSAYGDYFGDYTDSMGETAESGYSGMLPYEYGLSGYSSPFWFPSLDMGKQLVIYVHGQVADVESNKIYVYDYTPLIELAADDNPWAVKETTGAAPVVQHETEYARTETGEDEGTFVISDIIDGIDTKDIIMGGGAGLAALGVAHLLASGKKGGGKKDDDKEKKKKRSAYKMYIRKDFGDTLDKLNKRIIYARLAEITERGEEKPRNDLTAAIEIFPGYNVNVTPLGMREGRYMAAEIIAAEESTEKEGSVCFRYTGEGGTFTETVIFKLANPQIVFGQENLGLPAHYEKVSEVWFGVTGMTDPQITAAFDGSKCPYAVEIIQDGETKGLYCARITDRERTDKGDPGDTKTYHLRITATKDKEKAEGVFDISRVFMGLALKLEENALACYLKTRDGAPLKVTSDDLEPCVTKGRISLLYWNDEEQGIEKIALCPDKKVSVKAYKVENDNNSNVGEPLEMHQRMADDLGICIFPTKNVDTDGSRIVQLTCTKAGLDAPARIRAELTVSANYKGETFTAIVKVLLHSLPFRKVDDNYAYSEMLKQDNILTDKLTGIKSQIYSKYMKNLFSLYYFIDRMIDGYDPNFGYDAYQVQRVYSVWIRFVRGEFVGANAEAEKVTLADELNACYAFLQGMRDNGGFLGRMALGICTAGYSETLFFAMDLAEKMEDTIVRQGKDMSFWDGVVMGVKEYEKQVAMELLMAGGLKLANYAGGKMLGKLTGHPEGIDIGKTITQNYRKAMDAADSALKQKSGTYRGVSGSLEKIEVFTSSGAGAAKDVLDQSAKADAAAKTKAQTSIAQRRAGDLGLSPEQLKALEIHDGAMAEGMNKVRRFYELMKQHGTARKDGNLAEIEAKLNEAWVEVKTDKNAFKALKRMNDPYAQTVKAEFTRIRKLHRQVILDRVLDDVAQQTGKNRADLYFQSVTSNEAWKEDAGLTLSEDLDLTIRERCHSEASMELDPVIGQTMGENSVAREVYKEFHGGAEPPSIEVAKEFAQDLDVTYVSPMGDQGYVIEPNLEAFAEIKPLLDKAHLGDDLRAKGLDRATIAHKGKEWYNRGKKYDAKAMELETDALQLTGAERELKLSEATGLRYKAHGCYVEGARQITKSARNIVEPRGNMYVIKNGGSNPFTAKAREMTAAAEMVQEGLDPNQFFDYLKAEHGTDFGGFADGIAECLE